MNRKPSVLVIFLTVFIDLVGFGIIVPLVPVYFSYGSYPGLWIMRIPITYQNILLFCLWPFYRRGVRIVIGQPMDATGDIKERTKDLKAAVVGLTKTWAMELGPEGIRVNAICPGSVSGPRMDGVIAREAAFRGVDPQDMRTAYEAQVSMRSFIEASDIGEMIAFLASPAARFVHGQVLAVDGNTETLATI